MNGEEFVLEFPVSVVVYPEPREGQYRVLAGLAKGIPCISLFSEPLFAERARDELRQTGVVVTFNTMQELEPHLQLYEHWGLHHATIDPYTDASRYAVFTCERLREVLGGA